MATAKAQATHHVFSTMVAPVKYVNYDNTPSDLKTPIGDGIEIKGGAGLAHQDAIDGIYTPLGVSTQISEDELEYLNHNPVFQSHIKAGHIKVLSKKVDPEKAVGDMQTRDVSAPRVPQDFPDKTETAKGNTTKK